MSETGAHHGDEYMPPTPDHIRDILGIVKELTPGPDANNPSRTAGRNEYNYEDDEGVPHQINITDYRQVAYPEEPNWIVSVQDADLRRPRASTDYTVVNEGKEQVLKVEKIDATMLSTMFADFVGVSLGDLAQAALDDDASREAAKELGLDRGNATQAAELIRILELCRDRGKEDTE